MSKQASAPAAAGAFGSVAPFRVLDTRSGVGAPRAAVAANGSVAVQVTGVGGVPASGVSAVVVNLTVTAPTSGGFITGYADGAAKSGTSNLNFVKGQTIPNLAVVPVGADGKIRLSNGSGGTVQLIADISGYYLAGTPAAAGAFGSVAPFRVLDTRSGVGAPRAAVAANGSVAVQVTGVGGVPASGVSAVVVNLTVTAPTSGGFITGYADGAAKSGTSNLNFVKGQTIPNLAVVPVGADGKIRLSNGSGGTVQLIADISGYYLAGTPAAAGAFGSVAPFRVLDTRSGVGAPRAAVAANGSVAVQVTGVGGVPASGVSAVVVNLTVTAPTSGGFITGYADGAAKSGTSNLNFVKGQTIPNLAVVPVGADGKIRLSNGSGGTVQLIADISGYYLTTDRTLTTITAKPSTAVQDTTDVESVSGDPAGTQTTVLATAAATPAIGQVITAAASPQAPSGLLGTVTKVTRNPDGTTAVTTTPATLDQAYSAFHVSTSIQLTDADVTETSSDTVPATRSRAAATPAAAGAGGFSLKNVAFDCKGSGAGPTIALDADLSNIHLDFDLNMYGPSMSMLLTAYPKFDINIGFTAQITCSLAGTNKLEAHIPIAGTPPLDLVLSPVLTLTAEGQVSIDFNWSPRMAIGFYEGNGMNGIIHSFGSSASTGLSGTAGADLFLGMKAEVELADRIGIGGDFGPDLQATWNATTQCFTVDGLLKSDLTADADVFVKHWTFALATGTFGDVLLYKHCYTAPTPPVITTTTLPGGTVGTPYSTRLATADNRNGTWTLAGGQLPPGLTLTPTGGIAGAPTTAGRYQPIIRFTDSANLSTTAAIAMLISARTSAPGAVYAWGYNGAGELGDGTINIGSSIPVRVSGLNSVTTISSGHDSGYALRSDGNVFAWGYNSDGQLGDGTTTDRSTPVRVDGLTGVIALAGGDDTGYALRTDGTVDAWGDNTEGQIGDGTTTTRSTPVQVKGLTGVTAIAGGAASGYALRSDGTVYAWGENGYGQLGDGTGAETSTTPVRVSGLTGVTAIAGGAETGYALRSDGTVYAWGYNGNGELGPGSTRFISSTPARVGNLTGVMAIASGANSGYALRSDGTVYAWGYNGFGQLGDGTTTSRGTPIQVSRLTGVTAIAGGGYTGYALCSDGTVHAWGDNRLGELGDGTTTNHAIPVQVVGLTRVTAMAGGGNGGYALVTP